MKTSKYGALLGLASITSAQVASFCSPRNKELCYSVNVPDASASSGSGDIFIQIKAPASASWAGVGQGSQMAGSNIFVIYANADGTNVTLSPRLGVGEVEPEHTDSTRAELLSGSGIENGIMTANIRCSSCASWDGGSMDFSSSSSSWIWAMRQGSALSTNSNSAEINQHQDGSMGSFTLDLSTARGGSSGNPFVSQSSTNNPVSTAPSGNVGSSAGTSDGDSDSDSGSMSTSGGPTSNLPMLLKSHGIIMGLAFAVLFPLGVIIRAVVPKLSIWAHAGVQTLTYLLAWAGGGIGIYIARELNYLKSNHAIIGLVVLSVMIFQPIGGMLQHMHFKKHGSRGIFGHGHRFVGLALILLGIINGGLGLQLAGNTNSGEIAYGVVAGVFGLAMLAAFAIGTIKKPSSGSSFDKETKRTNGSNGSSTRAGVEH